MRWSHPVTLKCKCGQQFEAVGHYMYDPGVHTFRNGDPGYPPTEEVELEYNKDQVIKTPEGPMCVGCGAELDDQFEAFVKQAYEQEEKPEPGDDIDYDPQDDEYTLRNLDINRNQGDA